MICDKCKEDTPFYLLHRIQLNVVDDEGFVIKGRDGEIMRVCREWCETCLGWGSKLKNNRNDG